MNSNNLLKLHKWFAIIICLLSISLSQQSFGQAEAESENILLLQTPQRKNPRYLAAGTKVIYRVKGGERLKGQLDRITDSTFTISGNTYYPEELEMISGKSAGLKMAKVAGVAVMVLGAGGAGAGLALLSYADQTGNCGEAFLAIFFGVLLLMVGGMLLVIGAIPLFFRNKRYNLLTKWKLSITQTVPRKGRG